MQLVFTSVAALSEVLSDPGGKARGRPEISLASGVARQDDMASSIKPAMETAVRMKLEAQ